MRLVNILHAIGKITSAAGRVMGDYLKTIEDRMEMFFSPSFSEYVAVDVRQDRREAHR